MEQRIINSRMSNLKFWILTTVIVMILGILTPTVAQASTTDSFEKLDQISESELNYMTDKIMEHSTLDEKTGMYILNHSIVEEGIITEKQYDDAKQVEVLIMNEQNSNGKSERLAPLVIAAIAVIKAAAIFIGLTVAAALITYVTNWGVSVFCKKYKNKHSMLKSFCAANGF